jgi:hypothetical protein
VAASSIGMSGVGMRFVFSFALVCFTWNPTRYNYIEWALAQFGVGGRVPVLAGSFAPLVVFSGLALLAGWLFFLRTTARSLGAFGLLLCAAFAGTVLWALFYYELVQRDSTTLLSWIVLFLFSAILAMGMSWAHLRNRWSGQATVDDVDDN